MPIKPENRALYPANWAEIRREACERARWSCVHPECVAGQYEFGFWKLHADGGAHWQRLGRGETYSEARQAAAESFFAAGEEGKKLIVIVLTVAHLNHDPTDCRPENLAAMCQRHHLAHDHEHHLANAQATRRAKSGTAELF